MHHEFQTATCPNCGKLNHVLLSFAGDSRANNDHEVARCFNCHADVLEARCCWIFSGETEAQALSRLRTVQGQAA
jgi:hypothetical protein